MSELPGESPLLQGREKGIEPSQVALSDRSEAIDNQQRLVVCALQFIGWKHHLKFPKSTECDFKEGGALNLPPYPRLHFRAAEVLQEVTRSHKVAR